MGPDRDDDDVPAWRRAFRSTLAAEPAGCPDHDTLAALVVGELAAGDRARVADHITGCTRCTDDYRLLAELHHEATRARRARARWLWPSVAAAAVVAVAATLAPQLRSPERGPDGPRGGVATQGIAPAPGSELATAPGALAWSAEPGAQGYRVRLFDARAEPVWESPSGPQTSRALPPEVRARLQPGAAYFWVVDVDGTGAAPRLGPFWFRLNGGG